MGAIVLSQGSSPVLPSATKLAAVNGLPSDFASMLELPKEFLPELRDIYAVIYFMQMSARNWTQFPCSPQEIGDFLESDSYAALWDQLKREEAASEDDFIKITKIILSTLSIPQTISPEILAEVYMEIMRELQPSKLALHFARVSIRNSMTFVPSGKEFRDALLLTIKSLATLKSAAMSLPDEWKSIPKEDFAILNLRNEHKVYVDD